MICPDCHAEVKFQREYCPHCSAQLIGRDKARAEASREKAHRIWLNAGIN